jgi:hypothetical protein
VRLRSFLHWAACMLGILLCALSWLFLLPRDATFFADDLQNKVSWERGEFSSNLHQVFLGSTAEKWRPTYNAMFYVFNRFVGLNYKDLIYEVLLIHCINGALFCYLAFLLSRSKNTAFLLTVLFMISRFALYQTLQATGLVESLPLVFFLVMLIFLYRAFSDSRSAHVYCALFAFLFTIHAHERYVAVVPFLLAALWMLPKSGYSVSAKIAFSSIAMAILGFNVAVKKLVLGIRFFVGTGGVVMSPEPHQVFGFLKSGLMSIVGWNEGEPYLAGISFRQVGWPGYAVGTLWLVALAVVLVAVLGMIWSAQTAPNDCPNTPGKWFVLWALLLGSLTLAASSTFRQEQRWLYAPYAVLLLAIAAVYPNIRIGWQRFLCIALIFVAGFSTDVVYRPYLKNVFFMGWLNVSATVNKNIIKRYGKNLIGKHIVIVGDDIGICLGLGKGDFFQLFYPRGDVTFSCGQLLEPSAIQPNPDTLFFQGNMATGVVPYDFHPG